MRSLLAALLLFSFPAYAHVKTVCEPPGVDLAENLLKKYGEHPSAVAKITSGPFAGNLLELFQHPETGDWTMTARAPGEPRCILGVGKSWQALKMLEEEM